MPHTANPATLLQPVIHIIARQAGERILKIYARVYRVEEKSDKSPLTEADLAAHHVIREGLGALTPGLPFLSEVSPPIPFAERANWRRYWLVDPLDGTREFIKRNGEFTVNIALVDGHEAILGVVHAPALNRLYYAARGGGAWKQSAPHEPRRIHVRSRCPERIVVAGSRSHQTRAFKRFLSHLPAYELIRMGSAPKFCLVAEGVADIYARLGPPRSGIPPPSAWWRKPAGGSRTPACGACATTPGMTC